jgi:hypothetical protein
MRERAQWGELPPRQDYFFFLAFLTFLPFFAVFFFPHLPQDILPPPVVRLSRQPLAYNHHLALVIYYSIACSCVPPQIGMFILGPSWRTVRVVRACCVFVGLLIISLARGAEGAGPEGCGTSICRVGLSSVEPLRSMCV